MLNKTLLQDAQQVVAAGLLGQGVKVVFDAETPYADLQNKVMHLRPLPEKVDAETLLHLRADCDHEMGHFLCSDPTALRSIKDPMLGLITNAIEDGFVERAVTDRWFGCGENLRDSNEALMRALIESEDTRLHSKKLALTALQLFSFGCTRDEIQQRLGGLVEKDIDVIEDLIPELHACSSTQESVRLAREIDRRWRWTDPERPRGKGGDDRDHSAEGDDEEETGDGGAADGNDGSGGGPDSDGSKESNSACSEPKRGVGSGAMAKELAEGTLSAARKKIITETRFSARHYFARKDDDLIEPMESLRDQEMVNTFVDSVRTVLPTLRRRLLMEFRGVGTKREFDKRSGVIDRESLHKVAVGNPRVFATDVPHMVPGADVTLLVDMSGSMMCSTSSRAGIGPSRIYVASQAAYAFSSVLDLIGVPNEVLGFTTSRHFVPPAGGSYSSYTRIRPLHQLIVKPSGVTARKSKARFASMAHYDQCAENIDGECVMWAAQRLAARNRKGMAPILIVLSDGEPASVPEPVAMLNRHLKETVTRIEKAGINVIGVGIQTTTVQQFYKHSLVINDVKDLVGTSYEILRGVLRKARRVG